MKTAALYEVVTQNIIKELEVGAIPWVKPWKGGGLGALPANAATKRSYSGINIPILWHAADTRGFPTQRWMTFKQALDLKANVRKGEKGTHVVFTKQLTVKDAESEEKKKVGLLRAYTVFNVAQIDGLPTPEPITTNPAPIGNGLVDTFIASTKADIRIGGDRACFVPALDFIALPPQSAFNQPSSFYATALHELGHWSGHKSRLDRDLKSRFHEKAYAAEELIAELTAAFLCAHLGVVGELRHAGYIDHWIQLLKDDNRAIFTAASKASQAADYLRSSSETVAEEE